MGRGTTVAFVVLVGLLMRNFFSPVVVLVSCSLLLAFLLASSQQPPSIEQCPPVYNSGVAAGLRYGVAAVQGRRPYMEDMHRVVDFHDEPAAIKQRLHAFFAVFDGHGGKRAAAWAHTHLVSNLLHHLGRAEAEADDSSPSVLDNAAVDAFHATDTAFLKHAAARGIPDGSTAVTCMIQRVGPPHTADAPASSSRSDRRLLVANLGDSRCVMVRNDGSALALSSDHKPNRPDERARVQAAGGQVIYAGCWRVQGDLAVSRAFGDAHLKPYGVSSTPELSAISLTPRDIFLVLASDGLWDVVDEQQCASSVLRAPDPLGAARSLCDLASARGSMDNITVLVVALS